jgi:hypothetical protein
LNARVCSPSIRVLTRRDTVVAQVSNVEFGGSWSHVSKDASDRATDRSCGPDGTPSGQPGVIVTNLLRTRLLGPVSGQPWTDLMASEHAPDSSEFGCEGPLLRTTGSVGGVQAGDVKTSSQTSTTSFAIGEGEQALSIELSETGGSSWDGPDFSSEVAVFDNTAASTMEIRP